MHLITLSKPYHDKLRDRRLEPGTYLCEDLTAFEIGIDAERGTVIAEFCPTRAPHWTGSVLIVANGGYGDLLMATPAIREFRRMSPTTPIAVSCPPKTHCVFNNLPYAPKLLGYPLASGEANRYETVVSTEHLQECADERARTIPAIDIKAELLHASLDSPEKRRVEYIVSADEAQWALSTYPRTQARRIGIQLQASAPGRTYHPDLMSQVMRSLYDAGWEIFILGSPADTNGVPEKYRHKVRDLPADKLSFRQSAAVAKTCDVLLCPDSSFIHIAGALNIPAVGLFGVVDWKLRTADYPTVRVLQGREGCDLAPCSHHPKGHRIWPDGAPCEKAGHCVALNSIKPERVLATIEAQYKKFHP